MKTLYAIRSLDAIHTYENIENDLYKDLTCKGHKNCIVRIVPNENGGYKIVECVNDEAKEHEYFHIYATPLFESKLEAIKSAVEYKIKDYNKEISKRKKELAELDLKHKELCAFDYSEIKTPSINDFDFGDTVYLASISNFKSKILSFEVHSKVVEKSGVVEIRSEDFEIYGDEDCYDGVCQSGYNVDKALKFKTNNEIYRAFKDLKSAENALKKLEIQYIERKIKDCNNGIAFYEKYIKETLLLKENYEKDLA